MNPVTETKPCPKCRADMLMDKTIGDSQKWKCAKCGAVFFFDPEEKETTAGQRFFPFRAKPVLDYQPTAADYIGEMTMKPR